MGNSKLLPGAASIPDGSIGAADLAGSGAFSGKASYLKTADGVQADLIPAVAGVARKVVGHLIVDEVFADGDGAQPTFKIGETGSDAKFVAEAELTDAAAGTRIPFAGELSAGAALFATANDGSGTTFTGGITVTAIAVP